MTGFLTIYEIRDSVIVKAQGSEIQDGGGISVKRWNSELSKPAHGPNSTVKTSYFGGDLSYCAPGAAAQIYRLICHFKIIRMLSALLSYSHFIEI